jgi:hypothetical protein
MRKWARSSVFLVEDNKTHKQNILRKIYNFTWSPGVLSFPGRASWNDKLKRY